MVVEIQVFLAGLQDPVDLDTYAMNVALHAAHGTYNQYQALPAYFQLDDPKSGSKTRVVDPNWPTDDRAEQEAGA